MNTKLSLLLVALLVAAFLAPLLSAQPQPLQGPWVDEVSFLKEGDPAKVMDMIAKGDVQVYFSDVRVDAAIAQRLKTDPNINYKYAFGLYFELTFNPVGPEFPKTGKLNPFSVPRIREAMNYIVDRNYIVNEIMLGFAVPKWLPLISQFPEYAKLADTVKLLEAQYSYNFEKGKEIIFEEMAKLGATYKDGKWYYKGEPVVIKFLIRTEDQRRRIGDYVADQLEKLGFTVERMYKTAREASPIWIRGNPADGQWHIYTGGWITTAVSRDDSSVWGYFYTPLGRPEPLWQAYKPDPVFMDIATRLWNGQFKTIEERQELMAKAAVLALKDSVRVWLVDQIVPYIYSKKVDLAADLSGGFSSPISLRTLRYVDKAGGSVKAAMREVLVEPWNPVAGTNWVYDAVLIGATQGYAFLISPYTGLPLPERAVSAEVYALKGTPTTSSSDWCKLTFVDKVEVPADAWYSYDVKNNKVVTAGEAGVKNAQFKIVVSYGDVIGKIKYHDGTTMSLADWVIGWPLTFARVDPSSPLYDESAVPSFQAWRSYFIAWRFVSTSPLVIEYYVNYTSPDVELIVSGFAGWPNFPWHALAIGIRAEEKGLLAFSADKADKMKVEWMNYIGGPSLDILSKMLDEALAEGYIPFKDFMSKYVSVDEAKARYNALKSWYAAHKHFWVGDGPYYLDTADYNAHVAVLKANRNYPDKSDRWAWLATPPIPEVAVRPPDNVVPGLEAVFTIQVTYKGQPYPNKRMDFVKFLVLDPAGNVLAKGSATPTAEGVWQAKLSPEDTGKLTPGPYRIMVIALSKDVASPAIKESPFTVIPQIAYFQTMVAGIRGQLESRIAGVETGVSEVRGKISDIANSVSSLQGTVNTVLALSVLSLIIAVVAVFLALRKPKAETAQKQ
ncbi:ABC transporter substrate-binding protein [Thermofilum pendens]|uniref:Solute binding protein-like protein n=1 Tax=Thermofilum pendens (strain DSM 2475 / Hrk 5) TaxID=368408 RepID=A1RWH9_THEPD|nr:ABC transporter substrate-binding protein [Thermofilum pendens]ABL77559.1 solute binding protein-like protein [Thermofilum pendens Hrk 5]